MFFDSQITQNYLHASIFILVTIVIKAIVKRLVHPRLRVYSPWGDTERCLSAHRTSVKRAIPYKRPGCNCKSRVPHIRCVSAGSNSSTYDLRVTEHGSGTGSTSEEGDFHLVLTEGSQFNWT